MKIIILSLAFIMLTFLSSCSSNSKPDKPERIRPTATKSADGYISDHDSQICSVDYPEKISNEYPKLLTDKYTEDDIYKTSDGNYLIDYKKLVDSLDNIIIPEQKKFLINECYSNDRTTTLGYYIYQGRIQRHGTRTNYRHNNIVQIGFIDPKGKVIIPIGKYSGLFFDGTKFAAENERAYTAILNKNGDLLQNTNFDFKEWLHDNSDAQDSRPVRTFLHLAKRIKVQSINLHSQHLNKTATIQNPNSEITLENSSILVNDLLQYMLENPDHGDFFTAEPDHSDFFTAEPDHSDFFTAESD